MKETRGKQMQRDKLTGYPSIDRPWEKYYGQFFEKGILSAQCPQEMMYGFMYRRNEANLERTALRYFGNKRAHRERSNPIKCGKGATL